MAEIHEFPQSEESEKQAKSADRIEIMRGLNAGNILASFSDLPEEWRSDKQIVLYAVRRDGLALQYASAVMQNDPDVVEAAVTNTQNAWSFASTELQDRKELINKKIQDQLKRDQRAAISELKNEPVTNVEHPIYNPLKIRDLVRENWWKHDKFEERVADVAKAVELDADLVRDSIEKTLNPETLVSVKQGEKFVALLEKLRQDNVEVFAWTQGQTDWQRKKLQLTGADKFIPEDHIFIGENEKKSRLSEIFDKLANDGTRAKPLHVYVVDDKKENLNDALNLASQYEQKGIIIHDYLLKIKDQQADGTAFYTWISAEKGENPNLVVILLDFDQVIADTDKALDDAADLILNYKILQKQKPEEKQLPQAA